ncbi:hypothetical protein [Marinicauda salina]|uniref:hypothetical protein n=1 Tax=Marinicauda salina TaxID=2135793 RepID=UPI0011B1CBCB|nr:hypothetical protein [Marinicauda salina]
MAGLRHRLLGAHRMPSRAASGLRRRLAGLRRSGSPAGSILDFSVWTFRHGLSPRTRLFWVSLIAAVAAGSTTIFTEHVLAGAVALIVISALLTLALLLSYMRTMMNDRSREILGVREELGRVLLDVSKLGAEMEEQIRQVEDRLAQSYQSKSQGHRQKLDALRETLEQRVGDLNARVLRLDAEMEERIEASKNEILGRTREDAARYGETLHGEIDSLSRQIQRVSDDHQRTSDQLQGGLNQIAERHDDLAAKLRSTHERLDRCESSLLKDVDPLHDRVFAIRRELNELMRQAERESGNEARVIEHLERTVGELGNRIDKLEGHTSGARSQTQ